MYCATVGILQRVFYQLDRELDLKSKMFKHERDDQHQCSLRLLQFLYLYLFNFKILQFLYLFNFKIHFFVFQFQFPQTFFTDFNVCNALMPQ